MKDYERAWATVDPQFLPATTDLAGRKEFLDIMVNKEVMAIKADELGYDKDTYVVQGMEAFKKVGLQAAYLKINVSDNVVDVDRVGKTIFVDANVLVDNDCSLHAVFKS